MGRRRTLPDAEPRDCEGCGTNFTPQRKKWRQRFCGRPCARRASLRYDDPEVQRERAQGRWEGHASTGYIRSDGYVSIHVDGRKMLQHRYVMEQVLGRSLRDGEEVHHRNEVRHDNRPENLVLKNDHGEHIRSHHRTKKCAPGCTCRRHTWRRERSQP